MSSSEESLSSTSDNVDSGGNAIIFSIQQLSDVRFVNGVLKVLKV
jgi:hypothetical protein